MISKFESDKVTLTVPDHIFTLLHQPGASVTSDEPLEFSTIDSRHITIWAESFPSAPKMSGEASDD